jgi:hypothetical protein
VVGDVAWTGRARDPAEAILRAALCLVLNRHPNQQPIKNAATSIAIDCSTK